MLFLQFELDGERYALDAAAIVQVLAYTQARALPGTPAWIAGVIEHGGAPVPVIDVSRLALGRAARALRSTRLVLVRYRSGVSPHIEETEHLLGLILERATRTQRIERERFADSGVATPHARWLGPVASDAEGLVQWVDVEQMLDDETRALLFPAASAVAVAAPT
ncbi:MULTISPECIES: chemotaxis protein CheW [Paraburkholderia]|uniref:chemotaxis protein CheW n=1 Tax=Paraburkholderia TaxID=1822464 RepID=UPI00225B631E|nr:MULTISPECIES: chemotaxis protein CheW [Paraburkholderia]MCX4164133.1 chemotaxis protein CheW [Paraburkholderia megapolitana]MDN7159627.1 chemotaxis protein CheW [Paraburkholderia sp. CHISQ3]MDQ6496674.1 chemotaxis protein CheW [Paraburkholderia megapolitana]